MKEFSRRRYLLCPSRQQQFVNADIINRRFVSLTVSAVSIQGG
jgi:hypothetical protein